MGDQPGSNIVRWAAAIYVGVMAAGLAGLFVGMAIGIPLHLSGTAVALLAIPIGTAAGVLVGRLILNRLDPTPRPPSRAVQYIALIPLVVVGLLAVVDAVNRRAAPRLLLAFSLIYGAGYLARVLERARAKGP